MLVLRLVLGSSLQTLVIRGVLQKECKTMRAMTKVSVMWQSKVMGFISHLRNTFLGNFLRRTGTRRQIFFLRGDIWLTLQITMVTKAAALT